MPCTEKRARLLLERGRAVVHKMAPFSIRLKDRLVEGSVLQPLDLKLDPGSKTTGGAVVRDGKEAIGLYEVRYRTDIKAKMDARRALRRGRRNRTTRYREPRFNNRYPEKCACCDKNTQTVFMAKPGPDQSKIPPGGKESVVATRRPRRP